MKRSRAERAPLPAGFWAIWVTVAVDLVGFGIVLPILTLYAKRFHASGVEATALVAVFSAAQFVFARLWGRLSDRIGRKPVLILSLVGTALGSLITGLAGSLVILFVGRIVDGASGASISIAQAAVTDLAPPHERSRLLGLLGAAFGIGFVLGPALGALTRLGGPQIPFYVAAAIAGVNAIVAAKRVPETHTQRHLRDVTPRPSFSSIADLVVLAFVALVAFSGFEATFSLFSNRRLGFDEAGVAATFVGVGVLLSIVQGGLIRPTVTRLGEVRTVRVGLALNAVGLGLLAAVHHGWQLLPALGALVVGQGFVTPTLPSLLAGRVPQARRGGALGVQQGAGGLARVLGPLAGGWLFQGVGVGAPYVAGAAVMAFCAVALVRPAVGVEADVAA